MKNLVKRTILRKVSWMMLFLFASLSSVQAVDGVAQALQGVAQQIASALQTAADAQKVTILYAAYGDFTQANPAKRKIVTDIVQSKVQNNTLNIPAGSYDGLFGDPAPGVTKNMLLIYKIGNIISATLAHETYESTGIPYVRQRDIAMMEGGGGNIGEQSRVHLDIYTLGKGDPNFKVLTAFYGNPDGANILTWKTGQWPFRTDHTGIQGDGFSYYTLSMVSNNQIVLTGAPGDMSKHLGMIPSWDPVPGKVKGLTAIFQQNGTLYIQVVGEHDSATISAANATAFYTDPMFAGTTDGTADSTNSAITAPNYKSGDQDYRNAYNTAFYTAARGTLDGTAKGIVDGNSTGATPVDTTSTGPAAYQAAYTTAYDIAFYPTSGKTDGTTDGKKATADGLPTPRSIGTLAQAAAYKTAYIPAFFAAKPPIIPAGWLQEGDGAEQVTVGSENGEAMAWMIQTKTDANGKQNGVLYRYDTGTMEVNPWTEQTVKDSSGNAITDFTDVSAASDGTVCAVSAIGQVLVGGTTTTVNNVPTTTGGTLTPAGGVIYQYDEKNKNWGALTTTNDQKKATMFDSVSVGNKNNIWATEAKTNNLYQLVKGVWTLYPSSSKCIAVAAGLDGTVLAINIDDNVYEFDEKKQDWDPVYYTDATGAKQKLQLTQIAVGKKDIAWGINANGGNNDLWFLNKTTNNWERATDSNGNHAHGFVTISCNAAGTVIAAESNDTIWMHDLGGVNAQGQSTGKISAHAQAKKSGKIAQATVDKKTKDAQKTTQEKNRKAAVKKPKQVALVNGKKVPVDSKGNVIQTTPKVVGKKARAKVSTVIPKTTTQTTTKTPGAPKTRTTKPVSPAKKQAMKRN